MCYHNSLDTDRKNLESKYKKKLKENIPFKPIFHASAFEYLAWPIVTANQEILEMNWGLIPTWANTLQAANEIKSKTLNARIETLQEKPSFKNAQPCLVPSTGFFEWQSVGNSKIPYFIYLNSSPIFSLAGLYDRWVNEKGESVLSFSIVTTEANSLMEKIHNTKKRMPVILGEEMENLWLSKQIDREIFMKPYDENQMEAHTISSIINSKNHNVPAVRLAKTVEVIQQLTLF